MPLDSLAITFNGVELTLLADRAIYWRSQSTLIIADVHLGKDASFRHAGLPVPVGNSSKDLSRIDALLRSTHATRLVILGDLVHSRASHQAELANAFTTWRTTRSDLEIRLIRGNHDRNAGRTPPGWRIDEVNEPSEEGALAFAHHANCTERPHLCGHVHPMVTVRDFDRSFASLPCFVVEPIALTLPAFGSFTGGFRVERSPHRRIFVTTGKSIAVIQQAAD